MEAVRELPRFSLAASRPAMTSDTCPFTAGR